ncbi:hypothetical protein LTS18_011902 [Coniosporium uncinatum]|uniref:Uncharacterized protein n=1 Tax=Coniosporium uncinatum TaxID=93489 RepID=A0ACC3DCS5_9PEZI|nr:hypothetical protein LTS18_011902 [Coniosporium uncinatum]
MAHNQHTTSSRGSAVIHNLEQCQQQLSQSFNLVSSIVARASEYLQGAEDLVELTDANQYLVSQVKELNKEFINNDNKKHEAVTLANQLREQIDQLENTVKQRDVAMEEQAQQISGLEETVDQQQAMLDAVTKVKKRGADRLSIDFPPSKVPRIEHSQDTGSHLDIINSTHTARNENHVYNTPPQQVPDYPRNSLDAPLNRIVPPRALSVVSSPAGLGFWNRPRYMNETYVNGKPFIDLDADSPTRNILGNATQPQVPPQPTDASRLTPYHAPSGISVNTNGTSYAQHPYATANTPIANYTNPNLPSKPVATFHSILDNSNAPNQPYGREVTRKLVCHECWRGRTNCDNGGTCQSCIQKGIRCVRTLCKEFRMKGECDFKGSCVQVHEEVGYFTTDRQPPKGAKLGKR